MEKERILKVLKPLMFFDDQKTHLESEVGDIPMVHIHFGVTNKKSLKIPVDPICAATIGIM